MKNYLLEVPNTNKLNVEWKKVTDKIDYNYISGIKKVASDNNYDYNAFLREMQKNNHIELASLQRYGSNPFTIKALEYKMSLLVNELDKSIKVEK